MIAVVAAALAVWAGASGAAALAAPGGGGGGAGAGRTIVPNPRLWATVNVCDTDAHQNAIGIRGSMPGTGSRSTRMFMRFQVQYLGRLDHLWHDTGLNGDSGFIDVGSARFRARQAGRTFTVTPPPAGDPGFRFRGIVTFEWRRNGEVVRRAHRRTTGNHPNTRGADPPGFTAGSCVVR